MIRWYAVALVAVLVVCLMLGFGPALVAAISAVAVLGVWLEG